MCQNPSQPARGCAEQQQRCYSGSQMEEFGHLILQMSRSKRDYAAEIIFNSGIWSFPSAFTVFHLLWNCSRLRARNQRHWTHLAQPPLVILLLIGRNLTSSITSCPNWSALQFLRQLFLAFLLLGKHQISQRRLPWYEKHPGSRAALYHKHYLCSGNLKGLLCCILDTLFPDKTTKIWPYRYLMKQPEHPNWQGLQKIRRQK